MTMVNVEKLRRALAGVSKGESEGPEGLAERIADMKELRKDDVVKSDRETLALVEKADRDLQREYLAQMSPAASAVWEASQRAAGRRP